MGIVEDYAGAYAMNEEYSNMNKKAHVSDLKARLACIVVMLVCLCMYGLSFISVLVCLALVILLVWFYDIDGKVSDIVTYINKSRKLFGGLVVNGISLVEEIENKNVCIVILTLFYRASVKVDISKDLYNELFTAFSHKNCKGIFISNWKIKDCSWTVSNMS